MPEQAIILMSFAANDLEHINEETEKIWESVNQQDILRPKKIENADIEDLADAVIDAGRDLFMFHFGGHADEGSIVLDGFRHLDKIRLSRLLLPSNHNVQIVFLNGCLSSGQVDILTAKGVKAIIATNAKIDDKIAARMSRYFYKLFFEKRYSLKDAYETAEATVKGDNSFVTIVNPGETSEFNSLWTLFIHSDHKAVMDWTLEDFISNEEESGDEDSGHSGDVIKRQINMGNNSTYIENRNNTYISTVRDMVSRGKLKEALTTLESHLPDAAHEITLLKGRLSRLESQVRMGTLSSSDENIERNRIVSSILSIAD